MKEKSWVCTIFTQIFLCSVLLIVINIGQPQKKQQMFDKRAQSRSLDVLFMSVVGGFRPVQQQIILLKQMAMVAKVYNAQFVVNISELGDEDPLTLNATSHFWSLNVPWYTTKTSKGRGVDHYLKQVQIPYRKSLDVIAVNSELFQGPPTGSTNHQLLWLTKTLEESISEWRIIVGFHPLSACNGSMENMEIFEDLRLMFLRYGVNLYLSGLECAEDVQTRSTALLSSASKMEKGPYLTPVDRMFLPHKEQVNGFLLHCVSPLEFVTYFVNLKGEVVDRIELQQRGKNVM